jgi:hypothetical protein
VKKGECVVVAVFPIFGEATTSIEPANGTLDNPALRLDDKTFDVIASPDDLSHEVGHYIGDPVGEDRTGIGAVGKQLAQEGELSEQRGQQEDATVAVLDIGGCHQRVQHQAQRVDQDMALLALDQLAGIKAVWIDARAPFSALFTLWLSITQAVGLASRSAFSRHLT